ncbi:MAG TPA: nitrilase-related carbon-nitrogen hydrolase [Puia sp.]|nr:nitrilase-related carbon-nitrogen hydrolase [Puia sp.]
MLKTIQWALVLLSGVSFYLGFSLNGNFGWLIWIAPIPILYISLTVKPGQAFVTAFLAYLIGRMSWFSYLKSVMPVVPAILFTILLPLIFALIILATRKIILKSQHWFSVFAYPVLFTAFEYIVFIFSRDGTAASIGYTQSNYLFLIQIASLTGLLGISFLISFIPSSIALAYYFRKSKKTVFTLVFLLILLLGDSIIFSLIRLGKPTEGRTFNIGMVALDEGTYKGIYGKDPAVKLKVAELYLNEVSKLADMGAEIILIPEKVIFVNDSSIKQILNKFSELAFNRKIEIIIGGSKEEHDKLFNNAWVISNNGKLMADYQKVNLFEGEVLDGYKTGNRIAIFHPDSFNEGVAVCKDMDFQQFILGYSKQSPAVLWVPAWDFVTDGFLHSRMAIMRSVEGGFSMVRNARQGRLTISDRRGIVLYEANSENGSYTVLLGKISVKPHPTLYARAGDWFGTINLFAAIGFIIFLLKGKKRQPA